MVRACLRLPAGWLEAALSNISSIILRPDELSVEIIYPEYVRIKFSDEVRKSPVNIGVIAYKSFKREFESGGFKRSQYSYFALSEEILPGRLKFLKNLFDYLYISPNRESTKCEKLKTVLYLTTWFIDNGHTFFMESKANAIEAYVYWTKEIERQIKSGELSWSRKTAAAFQSSLLELFQIRFKDGIRFDLQQAIYTFKAARPIKKVRSTQEAGEVLQSLLDIAIGFTALVASEERFPYKMEYQKKYYYIFPNDKGYVKTKHTTFIIDSYDYEAGEIISPDKVKSKPLKERKVHLWTVKDALVNLERNNENMTSQVRLRFADLACCCYLEVFSILTGMHRSEVIQIENVDTISSEKSEYSNEFCAIKFRAKGKPTSYRLHKGGVKALLGYVHLRKWLVKMMPACELQHFFVRVVTPSGKDFVPPFLRDAIADDVGRVYRRLQGKFFPEGIKSLTPQEIRRLKTVVLYKKGVHSKVVADTLNHSEEVNLKTYANTRTRAQSDELAIFWRSVKEAAKQISIVQVDYIQVAGRADISISTGHCADYKNPIESEKNPLIEPNCKTQYGCLYCINYCCHADEVDMHKLQSLAFVISCLKSKSLYLDSHHDVISKLHMRVNAILYHVKLSSPNALNIYKEIEKRVWELGELTPFWELRLRRYESIGVVF